MLIILNFNTTAKRPRKRAERIWGMSHAFADIVRLAEKNGGKIPQSVPAYYVHHCYAIHREHKGLKIPTIEYNRMAYGVIKL